MELKIFPTICLIFISGASLFSTLIRKQNPHLVIKMIDADVDYYGINVNIRFGYAHTRIYRQ
jgi:hypothetical protein